MKRKYRYFILILVILLLSGCSKPTYPVQLYQEWNQIERVQLINEDNKSSVVFSTNSPDEIASIVSDIEKLTCYRFLNDPEEQLGRLHIDVLYVNGDSEYIGTGMIDYVPRSNNFEKGNTVYCGLYYIDYDSMAKLFGKYTGVTPSWKTQ